MRCLPFLLIAVIFSGCGPKLIRETVIQNKSMLIELREKVEDGNVVPRGYNHPATLADVRIAHILASISHEEEKGKRTPTIRSSHVYDLAEGISEALTHATPDQEVMAVVFSRDRRLGIFTTDHTTTLAIWIEGDQLMLDFYGIETEVEKGSRIGESDYRTPSVRPVGQPSFKLVAGEGQVRFGKRGLAVDWRNDYYRKPVSLRYRFGQVRRRTILMEETGPADEAVTPAPRDPKELSDAQLRALDQLEAARYAGYVSEAEYQRRRRLVLEGRIEEAGYGSDSR
ncbi:MAG: hypothetical protein GY725_17395 [bacterium]|nr:hypothetical protein [bacterium]